jgi:hypothetical protein
MIECKEAGMISFPNNVSPTSSRARGMRHSEDLLEKGKPHEC